MFEKFSNLDIDAAGGGGEYTVQAGFGWTNGVALWIANTYGSVLDAPKCPEITATSTSTSNNNNTANGATASVGVTPAVIAVSAAFAALFSGLIF
jgi:alpha,alpha-trehalase